MRTLVDINIFFSSPEERNILESLRECCDHLPNYHYEEDKSLEYEKGMGRIACQITIWKKDKLYAALFFTASDSQGEKQFLELVNIYPLATRQIDCNEYNDIAQGFAKAIRPKLKEKNILVKVKMPEKLVLKNIIKGKMCQTLFQRYIDNQNMGWGNFSHHPGTTQHLYIFIRHAASHRCKIDLQALYCYMIRVQNWSAPDAEWVKNRIEIGLEILNVR